MVSDNNEELSGIKTDIAVILERTKVLPGMNDKINVITNKQSAFEEKFKNQEKDICDLQKKSNTWDLFNSFGAFLAMIVGSIFGTGK